MTSTTTCPKCKSGERIHYFANADKPGVLVTRCGACNWRREDWAETTA
jgi:hypothetical protein